MPTLKDIQDRKVKLKGNKQTQTIHVRQKGKNGGPAIINVKNFHPDLHERLSDDDVSTAAASGQSGLEAENAKAAEAQKATTKARRVTPLTRLELGTMTMEALKMTPEWNDIPASRRSKLNDKDKAIDAIIDQRKVSGR